MDDDNEFDYGTIGIVSIPKVYQSEYSEIVDNAILKATAERRSHQYESVDDNIVPMTVTEINDRFNRVKGEQNEKEVFHLLHAYFKLKQARQRGKPDDCLILTNQNVVHPGTLKSYERDFIIVNLTAGYIMNLEAKSYLNKARLHDLKGGANEQLRMSKEIVQELFGGMINEDWKFISAIFCAIKAPEIVICVKCRRFVIEKERPTHFKDFCYMMQINSHNNRFPKNF